MRQETSGGSLAHVDLLRQVVSGLTSRVEEILVGDDLTLDQWRVLHTLTEGGPLSMSDLGGRTRISGPTLTRIVDRLIERSLLYRNVDATDRRRVVVHAAERGRALCRSLTPRIAEAERDGWPRCPPPSCALPAACWSGWRPPDPDARVAPRTPGLRRRHRAALRSIRCPLVAAPARTDLYSPPEDEQWGLAVTSRAGSGSSTRPGGTSGASDRTPSTTASSTGRCGSRSTVPPGRFPARSAPAAREAAGSWRRSSPRSCPGAPPQTACVERNGSATDV